MDRTPTRKVSRWSADERIVVSLNSHINTYVKIEPIEAVEQPQNIQSLEDIAAYKDKLRKQIEHEEECIAGKWNELFHKEEPAPQGKAQKLLRMVSLGSGMFDGMMLGWKLYRKYQEGAFLFEVKKKHR